MMLRTPFSSVRVKSSQVRSTHERTSTTFRNKRSLDCFRIYPADAAYPDFLDSLVSPDNRKQAEIPEQQSTPVSMEGPSLCREREPMLSFWNLAVLHHDSQLALLLSNLGAASYCGKLFGSWMLRVPEPQTCRFELCATTLNTTASAGADITTFRVHPF